MRSGSNTTPPAYGLPLAAAAAAWPPPSRATWRHVAEDLGWIVLGFVAVGTLVLAYFAAHGALEDLRLATLDYNLRYSNETYAGPSGLVRYLVDVPNRAGQGRTSLVRRRPRHRAAAAPGAPQPVEPARLQLDRRGGRLDRHQRRTEPAELLRPGEPGARPGSERRPRRRSSARPGGFATSSPCSSWVRSGGSAPTRRCGDCGSRHPGFVENVRYDLDYIRGSMDRDTYLSRFHGQKHDALENEQLRSLRPERRQLRPDSIFVFGFSGGSVCWLSERVSSSRFFWSRPVTTEFAADHPGYGSQGLLADLDASAARNHRAPERGVALARLLHAAGQPLRNWLEAGYTLDHETPMFSVWRRKP